MKYKQFVEEYTNSVKRSSKEITNSFELRSPEFKLHHTNAKISGREAVRDRENSGERSSKEFDDILTEEPTEYSLTTYPTKYPTFCPSGLPTSASSNNIISKTPPTIERDDLVYGITSGLGSLFFMIIVLYVYCNYTKHKNKRLYQNKYTTSISSTNIPTDIYDKYNSFF
jgi:hypothetical protein